MFVKFVFIIVLIYDLIVGCWSLCVYLDEFVSVGDFYVVFEVVCWVLFVYNV